MYTLCYKGLFQINRHDSLMYFAGIIEKVRGFSEYKSTG